MPLDDTAAAREAAAPPAAATAPSRFAVVFRLFQWDGFVARQAERTAAVSAGGDFFLSVDETAGPVPIDAPHRVFRTTDHQLAALGLPNRFGQGSLVWWNSDYPHYAFADAHPHYDHYVFVEYDSLIRMPVAELVRAIRDRDLDLVAAQLREPGTEWFWQPHSRRAYADGPLLASLNCVTVLSRRALRHLHARRIGMGAEPAVRHWPIGEAFVATEIRRGGLHAADLREFGDDAAFDWFPPILEERLAQLSPRTVFVHPVLDPARLLASVLRNTHDWRGLLRRDSDAGRLLATLPDRPGSLALLRASWRRRKVTRRMAAERHLLAAGAGPEW